MDFGRIIFIFFIIVGGYYDLICDIYKYIYNLVCIFFKNVFMFDIVFDY